MHAPTGAKAARPPDRAALVWATLALPLLLAMTMWLLGQAPAHAQPFDFGRDRPIVLPERPILCAPPRVMRGGRCVMPELPVLCPPPRVMRGGRCEMPVRPVVCLPPRVMRDGRCVMPAPVICAPPRVMRDGRCVMPPPVICLPPRVMRDGRCVMPAPVVCRPPRVMRDGRCVMPPPVICAPPRVMRDGRCVMPAPVICRPPRIMRDGRCVMPPPVVCRPPRVMRDGRCVMPRPIVCRPPEVRRGDRCVLLPDRPPVCRLPYIYSARARRCVLPAPIPPSVTPPAVYPPAQRSPAPQDNIAWIQSCLNAAGYDAGPVDGLSGRRTREAWSDFRRDNDLGEGQAPYTDPETLASLFNACTPDEAPAAPGGGAGTPADGDSSASGNDGDAGAGEPDGIQGSFTPAPAMCATGRLYSLLSAEQETLEPCGRSCIPAPEGMGETELLEQQEKQGITWCTSCVSVGNLGMLCPAPADAEAEPAAGEAAKEPAAN
jgi:hypothetical protein